MRLGDARRRLAAGIAGATLLASSGVGRAESEFSDLPCVDLGASVTDAEPSLGIAAGELRETLFGGLRTKLPRLRVHASCSDTLRLVVVLARQSADVFYGTADMALLRRAIVVDTGQFVRSEVWRMTFVLYGPPAGARSQILGLVEEMLMHFAADYHRAGGS